MGGYVVVLPDHELDQEVKQLGVLSDRKNSTKPLADWPSQMLHPVILCPVEDQLVTCTLPRESGITIETAVDLPGSQVQCG